MDMAFAQRQNHWEKESVEGGGGGRGLELRCVWQWLCNSVLSKPSELRAKAGEFHCKLYRNKTRREKLSIFAKPRMLSEGEKRHVSKQYTQNDPLRI